MSSCVLSAGDLAPKQRLSAVLIAELKKPFAWRMSIVDGVGIVENLVQRKIGNKARRINSGAF